MKNEYVTYRIDHCEQGYKVYVCHTNSRNCRYREEPVTDGRHVYLLADEEAAKRFMNILSAARFEGNVWIGRIE